MKPDNAVPSLSTFILRVLLWLPVCLAAWYYASQPHSLVVGGLARVQLNLLYSGIVSGLEQAGQQLAFVTTLKVYPAPGQVGVVVPEVNPLLYSYGLAFFLALMLASRARWEAIIAGVTLLLPFQSWGIAFDFLAQVGIKLGPEVAAQVGVTGWQAEGIAIGYQLGTLILPSLVPVALWAALNRPFIQGLLQRR